MRRLCAICVGASLVLAACGGDDSDVTAENTSDPSASTATSAPDESTTTALPTSTAVTSSTAPCEPLEGGATDRREGGDAPTAAMLLTDVGVDPAGCNDVVTFAFNSTADGSLGYSVEYQAGPFTEDASGEPVAVAGEAFLAVRLEPAYGYDFETGTETYTGSRRIAGEETNHVTEVVETGDFEAVVNWVIGLDSQRPFTVAVTGAPDHSLVLTIG